MTVRKLPILAVAAALGLVATLPMPASSQGEFVAPRFASPEMKAGEVSCRDLTALREPDLRIEKATLIEPSPTWSIPHARPEDERVRVV